ncbi:phosphodiesterase [Streptomyces sp. S.PNR 29]|uniref:phosphodiesterase n=1 Tax=Streptomyces sp. S.PNR 29 TaxID=2973805 RepID=UPI0025B233F6|nr:phosphodiesterase [Streptomyces sp. S.PNR 29]MDN0197628.1 phosphodiesterase [Streptomyces sp. S.PNR 29]
MKGSVRGVASPRDDAPAAGRSLGKWPAATVEGAFRLLARLRGGPALHPQGLTCAGDLEVVDDGGRPWNVPWLDAPGRYAATVRLSRAAGLPRRLPDGLGLAVRVEHADGTGRSLDLLLTSSGRGRVTRHLPLPRADAVRGPYSSLVSYRVGGRRRLLAAFPRRSPKAPVHGDPASLSEALATGPLVFDLCAETTDRSWRAFAVLTVRTPLPLRQEESLGFDIFTNRARGFAPGGALATTRRAAYHGSRAGRRGRAVG